MKNRLKSWGVSFGAYALVQVPYLACRLTLGPDESTFNWGWFSGISMGLGLMAAFKAESLYEAYKNRERKPAAMFQVSGPSDWMISDALKKMINDTGARFSLEFDQWAEGQGHGTKTRTEGRLNNES